MCLTGEVAGTWHLERENLESSRRPRWDDQTNSSHHSWLRGIWDQCILAFEASAFWHLRPVYFGIWDQCILAWEASAFWHLRPVHFGMGGQCISGSSYQVLRPGPDTQQSGSCFCPAMDTSSSTLLHLLLFIIIFIIVFTIICSGSDTFQREDILTQAATCF